MVNFVFTGGDAVSKQAVNKWQILCLQAVMQEASGL